VRIPDYPFLREVCRLAGGPLALTSANYSAESSTLEVSEFAPLHNRLHTVFDGGRLGDTEEARMVVVMVVEMLGMLTVIVVEAWLNRGRPQPGRQLSLHKRGVCEGKCGEGFETA